MIYNNRYRVDAKIGEGGMAVVYRGYDLLLRRQVAIKVLRPQFAADEDFVQRFYQEAQAAARLSHPKIVNTYDVGENDGTNYIVQEYVGGETLAALIEREGKLPEAAAVRYTQQICRALSAAHRADLLHRDIKPSNILVTPDDDVRVADFGIAGAAETQGTASDAIMGSVPYCAPEVLAGDAVTEATDLYSVGIVMYEMLTGSRPYQGESAQELAAAQARGIGETAIAGAGISPALQPIIRKLIDPAPKRRYQTAGELLGALRRVARGESNADDEEPGPDSPTAVLRRRSAAQRAAVAADDAAPATWSGRRLAIFAAAAFVLVVLVAGVFTAMQSSARGLRMPDVSGKAVADAVDLLHQSGINDVAIKQHSDPKTESGLIDGTQPAAGSPMQATDRVTLLVSAGPQSTAVPNVVGKDLKTATATLAAAGFSVQLGTAIHSGVTQGSIAKTNPSAGSPAEKSGTVVLFPSSGPQSVSVPNVVSMSDNDARTALKKLGLTLQVGQVVASDNIPAHTIIDQDPTGGTPAKPNSTVTVTLSGGPNAVSVPSVVGGTVDDARRVLAQAGLAVGSVAQAMDSGTTPGTVVSQNPQANAQTAQGGTVDLVVAANSVASPSPAPTGSAAQPDQAAPAEPIPNVVGMTVDAARAALLKAGYTVDKVTMEPGSPPDAKVIATDPPVGTVPAAGARVVNLVLGPSR